MEEPPLKQSNVDLEEEEGRNSPSRFSLIGEDLHQDILSRLPALTFAFAACVSTNWNRICNRILSRPKFVSALSLNPLLEVALEEVVNKVLGGPIRPHFAIACIGKGFCLSTVHDLVTEKFGLGIPIITSRTRGIIGRDVFTNELKEVNWAEGDTDGHMDHGITLMVGFVPGVKVRTFLLTQLRGPPQMSLIDKFVNDIKDFTASVSGRTSPIGILLFADLFANLEPVLEKMDYAMSGETVVIGDHSARFLYSSGGDYAESTEEQRYPTYKCRTVSLVFATEIDKPPGVGEIQFMLASSAGVSPVGPVYKGASVKAVKYQRLDPFVSTWLTAKRLGSSEMLDGATLLNDFENEEIYSLYFIMCYVPSTDFTFSPSWFIKDFKKYHFFRGDEEYLYVKGDGIRTGDEFRFYRPDPEAAFTSRNLVFQNLEKLNLHKVHGLRNNERKEVFGGLLFSCCGRGKSFFERENVDSSAFSENFPSIPLAGMFCCGEIGYNNFSKISTRGNKNGQSCYMHVYAAQYLVMLYTPKCLGQ
ncbi:hypothetical protein GIB67_038793 [Kingdonia uniflora]|uniref:FIST C-domain domain-containing protein n=1 Tax=Kingdonia uniflora TaxID=39325 RepID=A0A7J7M0Y1_9MAGN|nr:hypothetical protein GIB67_038793 [Kingdonia uniflora]